MRLSVFLTGSMLLCIAVVSATAVGICGVPGSNRLLRRVDHVLFPMLGSPSLDQQMATYRRLLTWGFPEAFPGSQLTWPTTNETFWHAFVQMGLPYAEMMVEGLYGVGLKSCLGYNETQEQLTAMGISFDASSFAGEFDIIFLHVPSPGSDRNHYAPPQMLMFFVFYEGINEDWLMEVNQRKMLLQGGSISALGQVLMKKVVLRAVPKIYPVMLNLLAALIGDSMPCDGSNSTNMCVSFQGMGGPDLELVSQNASDEFLFRTSHVEIAVADVKRARSNLASFLAGDTDQGCLVINNTALSQALAIHICQL